MAGDIDALIRKLDRMHSSIDDDVDEVLKNNAGEFARDTVVSAKSVMNKGYWTGNLARMIRDTKEGNMKYAVTSNAGYSSFLNTVHATWLLKRLCSLFMKNIQGKSERTSRN